MALPNNGDWVELRFGADLLEANKSEPVYADGHAGQYTVRFTPWVTGFTLVRWEHLNATGSAVGLRTVFGTHIGANSEHQVWGEAGRAAGQFVWRPVVFDYSFVLMSSDRQFLANTRQSDRHAWTVGAVFDECMIAWSKVTDNRVPDQTKVSTSWLSYCRFSRTVRC